MRAASNQRSPIVLAQSAAPSILVSSGTSNATGQITLGTALPYTPVGTVLIYLPAGVVTSGKQTGAGLYPVTFSSTTVCQLTDGTAVTANAAYTQTTGADIVLASVNVPGGSMGPNGALRWTNSFSFLNNANNKIINAKVGSTSLINGGITCASFAARLVGPFLWYNRGVTNSQVAVNNNTTSTGYTALDTTAQQVVTFTGQLATATDYIILEGYTLEVIPG